MDGSLALRGSDRGSVYQNLEDAVCLLALITKREPELEQTSTPFQGLHEDDGAELDGVEEVGMLSDIDVDRDEQQYLNELRSKLLDRLAETLARFKTKDKSSLDAKHVTSTMMVLDKERRTTKIICTKNEGLDKFDRRYLKRWKACVKNVAAKGEVDMRRTSGPQH